MWNSNYKPTQSATESTCLMTICGMRLYLVVDSLNTLPVGFPAAICSNAVVTTMKAQAMHSIDEAFALLIPLNHKPENLETKQSAVLLQVLVLTEKKQEKQ